MKYKKSIIYLFISLLIIHTCLACDCRPNCPPECSPVDKLWGGGIEQLQPAELTGNQIPNQELVDYLADSDNPESDLKKIIEASGTKADQIIKDLDTETINKINWDDEAFSSKIPKLGDKVNNLKPEQATETVYNNLDDTQIKNLNGDLWKEFMAKDKPLTGLQDGAPEEVAKGLQQQGHAVDNIDFGITPVNYDSGTLYVDPLNNPTTINLNSFNSGSHSIAVGPRGVVKIDNRLSIRNANNVGASGNIITADSIQTGSTTLTQTINGQPSSFTTTFDNVQQAYFMPDSFAFQSVDSLTITQNTTALTYIISDANNITFDGQNLLIDHADSVIIGNNIIAANADNIKIPFTFTYELFDISFELDNYQEILVERSDLVQIGDRTYTNLSNARFITNNDTIVYANVTAKTHNIYEFENPLFDEFYFV